MTKIDLSADKKFEERHNGPSSQEIQDMLQTIGADSVDQLINETVPSGIRMKGALNLPNAKTEHEFLSDFKVLASKTRFISHTSVWAIITPLCRG